MPSHAPAMKHHHPHMLHANLMKIKWPSSLTFPLILFVIISCFYWKLVFTYQYDWIWGPDLSYQILPWFEEEARQIQHSQFPLWDPHSWMGQPLLAQAQPGAAYPLNWLLWLIPRQHGHIQMWALQWYYVMIHYMGALFCFLLCRDLGRSRMAALIAGLAFGLAGYIGTIDWPQMVNGAVWAPLVFLFLLRAIRGVHPWASASWCGACLGLAWLSGHHQIPIFLTLAVAGTWLYYIFREGRPNLRIAQLAVVAMIFGPIVGALQIFPAEEFGRLAWRWVGATDHLGWHDAVPYNVHISHELHPISLVGIFILGFNTGAPFIGLVAVSLAALGFAIYWRQQTVKLFGAIAMGGLIYTLGGHSVFQGFIYSIVPFVEKARVPAMAIFLFHLGLVVVAAYGVDALRSQASEAGSESRWVRRINYGVATVGSLLAVIILALLLGHGMAWNTDDRVAVTMFVAFLLAALLYAWRTKNLSSVQALTLLTLLLLFEVGNESSYMLADRNDWGRRQFVEKVWSNSDLGDFLQRQPGPFRVETQTQEIERSWGDFYNVDFPSAYAGVTINSFNLETHTLPTMKLVGVKYTLARAPTRTDQVEVFRGASGIAIYENPDVFPRAWAIHEFVRIKTPNEGRSFIDGHVQDLQSNALITGDPPRNLSCPGAQDSVSVTKYAAERVALEAKMSCDGMVVLSDTYYPGWDAKVDGRPAQIYEVDMALRGVVVPAGTHQITFAYRPRSFIFGIALTFAGLIGAVLITIVGRRKAV
jgi:membrane protein YfhO